MNLFAEKIKEGLDELEESGMQKFTETEGLAIELSKLWKDKGQTMTRHLVSMNGKMQKGLYIQAEIDAGLYVEKNSTK